jgi:biotin carboxyl carrier protein
VKALLRLSIALALLSALGVGAWSAYQTVEQWKRGEERTVPLAKVSRGDVAFPITTKGSVQGGNSKMLVAPMTGSRELTITQLSKPGELVKEGDVVAQFDTTEESFKLREAEFDLREAEQLVAQATAESEAREEELNAELIVARGEWEQARLESRRNPLLAAIVVQQNQLVLRDAADRVAKLEKEYPQRKAAARAAVTIQEAALKKAGVTAGYVNIESNTSSNFFFPGMTFPMFQVGDNIRAGMAVAQIPDFNSWEASVVITEADRGLLAIGQPAQVHVVALPGKPLAAKVSNLGGTSGPPWERRFECKLAVTEPAAALRPGMSVRVQILTETMKNALWVPTQAVFESDGRRFAYVSEAGSFVARDVKIVRRGESQVVIEGLAEGTAVALASPDQQDAAKGKAAAGKSGPAAKP